MGRSITVRACAKINWTLRVGARRDDGFHDVRTVMQSIALADTLVMTPSRGQLRIECTAPDVPLGKDNLVWRAAAWLWRSLGRAGDPRGLYVVINKHIPSAAGLGGGSADAAATLIALNRMWDANWTRARLMELAAEIGSDVPFFLMGGTAMAVGRGEELYPLEDIRRQTVIVVKPSVDVKTADAYRWFDDDRAKKLRHPADGPSSLDVGWSTGSLGLGNDLQAPVARRHPVVSEAIEACLAAGASMAAMSGSGSAVFAVFPAGAAVRAAARLGRADWQVLVTRTVTRREGCRP